MENFAATRPLWPTAPTHRKRDLDFVGHEKGDAMRDIRGDLRDRAYMVQHRINAEHAQFETLILQLKMEQDRRLEPLKAQLRAVNKLIDVAAWQYDVRAVLTLATAVAAAAETSAGATAGRSHADGPPR